MDDTTYCAEAAKTASAHLHKARLTPAEVYTPLHDTAEIAKALDLIKKALFYTKEREFDIKSHLPGGIFNAEEVPHPFDLDLVDTDVFHAIVGIASEAGELVQALLAALTAKQPLDTINLREELGDLFWYMALLARKLDYTFEQAKADNIAKLRVRYGQKFTADGAMNRDLAAERAVFGGAA